MLEIIMLLAAVWFITKLYMRQLFRHLARGRGIYVCVQMVKKIVALPAAVFGRSTTVHKSIQCMFIQIATFGGGASTM